MKKVNFSIDIAAAPERVWEALWHDENYRNWTSAFGEGSRAESDWQEGSKILFLGGSGDEGMSSRIARKIPNQFMSFEHLGVVKDGVEDFSSTATDGWAGSHENYTLTPNAGGTRLDVELDTKDDFETYFRDTFPKALARVKEIAEN